MSTIRQTKNTRYATGGKIGAAGHLTKGRRRKKKNSWLPMVVFLLLLLGTVLIGWARGRVAKHCVLEAGEAVEATALVRYGNQTPEIIEPLTEEETVTPGIHSMKVSLWPFTYRVTVEVKDTIPPTGSPVQVNGGSEGLLPDNFVQNIQDKTEVKVTYKQMPDFTLPGVQKVYLLLTDLGDNFTEIVSEFRNVNLRNKLVLEAGSPVPDKMDFLAKQPGDIEVLTDLTSLDTSIVGNHEINVVVDGMEASLILEILDTIPPSFSTKRVEGWIGKAVEPGGFIFGLVDATQVQYAYVSTPDWSQGGAGTAEITVTDAGGNVVNAQVEYSLSEDNVPPEVAVSSIDVIIGESVSYKKAVGYSDNCDSISELKLEVDNSKVNLNIQGEYPVTYTVTDNSGNSTVKTGSVFVWEQQPLYYDENEVNAAADKILATILKEDMPELEKARAIYDWLHGSIGYINHSEKGDWIRGAYEGLIERQGDCFVYACTAKVLLTRAGIENMDIVKSQVNPSHFWNLVDVGEGWYHFDATPRKDKTVFFMWTDAQLREYSELHKNTHIYDESLYPEIN